MREPGEQRIEVGDRIVHALAGTMRRSTPTRHSAGMIDVWRPPRPGRRCNSRARSTERRPGELDRFRFDERDKRGRVEDRVATGLAASSRGRRVRRSAPRSSPDRCRAGRPPTRSALRSRRSRPSDPARPCAWSPPRRLLVDDGVEADASTERDARALHGEHRRGHGGDAALHVARAEPVQPVVADDRLERIRRPSPRRPASCRCDRSAATSARRRTELGGDVRATRMHVVQTSVDATCAERSRSTPLQRPRPRAGSRSAPPRDGRADRASRRRQSRQRRVSQWPQHGSLGAGDDEII